MEPEFVYQDLILVYFIWAGVVESQLRHLNLYKEIYSYKVYMRKNGEMQIEKMVELKMKSKLQTLLSV